MLVTVKSAISSGCCKEMVMAFAKLIGRVEATTAEIPALARKAGGEWLGRVACYAPGIALSDRVSLAREAGGKWLGQMARYTPGLTPADREALAHEVGW
ncbi:MAG: hypothetical protein UY48_C0003G0045 [Candidatus Gottesmanbacteria bacterium GW2011_GWB1_49_7]|uniref:Uncharacterized protein n=1 Tax=Candidatus Gottesmanbacteria bacterium GW2011_GWB1_49_7 TaxID=1618448 RepID=A0A0G1W3E7_9BACT|nr:MAG: hypothetical protein UY48_C0003G0045 [Candidatus Gottesmanbacteria bacterium GW2011_GWB1_49_7]